MKSSTFALILVLITAGSAIAGDYGISLGRTYTIAYHGTFGQLKSGFHFGKEIERRCWQLPPDTNKIKIKDKVIEVRVTRGTRFTRFWNMVWEQGLEYPELAHLLAFARLHGQNKKAQNREYASLGLLCNGEDSSTGDIFLIRGKNLHLGDKIEPAQLNDDAEVFPLNDITTFDKDYIFLMVKR